MTTKSTTKKRLTFLSALHEDKKLPHEKCKTKSFYASKNTKNHCHVQINNVMNDDRCHQQMSCRSFTKQHFFSHHPISLIMVKIYYSNFGYMHEINLSIID